MKTKAQVIHCRMVEKLRPDELEAFKEAFDMFDRNMDGTISTKVGHKNGNRDNKNSNNNHDNYNDKDNTISTKELHAAMRRGGQNPTESEVQDMINTVRFRYFIFERIQVQLYFVFPWKTRNTAKNEVFLSLECTNPEYLETKGELVGHLKLLNAPSTNNKVVPN